MKIKKISLFNFRSYKKAEFSFPNGCVIFVGDNACGKTTILEAIDMLSSTRSFKSVKDKDLIKFSEENFYIQSVVSSKGQEYKLSICYSDKGKTVFKNDNVIKRLSDFLSNFFAVGFSSYDFKLINGSPLEKRNYFNLLNFQLDKNSVTVFNEYNKLLKERNYLLKKNKFAYVSNDEKLRYVIELQLIDKGKKIINYRLKLEEEINKYIDDCYFKLMGSKDDHIQLKYIYNVVIDNYDNEMKRSLVDDFQKGSTGIGPHKDNFEILLNGKNIAVYGSQGQQRDALISLKMAILKIIKDLKGVTPILWLDDVFSELDPERQNRIVENIDINSQTFITTTSLSDIKKEILSTATIINLNGFCGKNVDNLKGENEYE